MDRLPKTALRLSPALQYASLLIFLLSLGGLVASGLTSLQKLLVLLFLLLLVCLDRPLHRMARVKAIAWEGAEKGWQLWVGNEARAVSLRGETVMTRWWISLNFVDAQKRRYALVLLPDSLSADSLRLLRVILRHGLS